jgi:hypothetical protein
MEATRTPCHHDGTKSYTVDIQFEEEMRDFWLASVESGCNKRMDSFGVALKSTAWNVSVLSFCVDNRRFCLKLEYSTFQKSNCTQTLSVNLRLSPYNERSFDGSFIFLPHTPSKLQQTRRVCLVCVCKRERERERDAER